MKTISIKKACTGGAGIMGKSIEPQCMVPGQDVRVTNGGALNRKCLGRVVACLSLLMPCCLMARHEGSDTMSLSPFFYADGQFRETILGGQSVWQSTAGNIYLYFDVPALFAFRPGSPVYLMVTYYDEGYGMVGVHYDSTKGNALTDIYREHDKQTGSSRRNSKTFVEATYELSFPEFAGRQNGGADFRLFLGGGGNVPLSVKSVTIQNHPFETTKEDVVELTPFSWGDGQFRITAIDGETVWENIPGNNYLYFDVPDSFEFIPASPVYLRVCYHDGGHGLVSVQYDSTRGNTISDIYYRSETHTRSSRTDTGTFVNSYHELLLPNLAGRQNCGADFRLCLHHGDNVPLSVKSVTIQNRPFENPQFLYVLTKPWLGPYTGPTKDYVDRSTLNHKVMVGYQGWFRTPNDLADRGWFHWNRGERGALTIEDITVDQWPDLSEYGEAELCRAGNILTRSGEPAYLFSSTAREIVYRHFQWMRKYNIDGALVQRFVHPMSSGAWGNDEWVLHHVREAANREGRIWAIEYAMVEAAIYEPGPLEVVKTDWKWLVDVVKIRKDPRYAYEGSRPVVFIYGLPFPDYAYDRAIANAIVDFLKSDPYYGGNYVVGGVPWWWLDMTDWYDHFQRYDGILAWMPIDRMGYEKDFERLRSMGIDYFPHVHPGFSWANMFQQTGDTDYSPREGGAFFWRRIRWALGSGATRLFIGMFDEYDEGTAIMPMSDDPPYPAPDWGRFITNEGRPSDWWMQLAGEARAALLGHRPLTWIMPTEEELTNRSNVGPEAWIDLGTIDESNLLYRRTPDNGNTSAGLFAGRDCRQNTLPQFDHYFYFDVAPHFAYETSKGLDITIEVEYYDQTDAVEISLDYDGIHGPYISHPKSITTQGTGEWRTVRFELLDAYLGDRQNGNSDFRIVVGRTAPTYIDRVWVIKSATTAGEDYD